MQLLSTSDLIPGMVIAQDVVSDSFVNIVSESTVVTKELIEKLDRLEIQFVYILTEMQEDPDEKKVFDSLDSEEALDYNFSRTITAIKNIFSDLMIGSMNIKDELEESMNPLLEGILHNNNILSSLRKMTYDDEYLFKHSLNVGMVSAMIGKWLNLEEWEIKEIATAGAIHDIGKSKIPRYVLNKPNELSQAEFGIVKQHSNYGFNLLTEGNEFNSRIKEAVLSHHERFDGSGYPNGLAGENIPLYGRIIAIADSFDAMTQDKVYSGRISPFKAAENIKQMSFSSLDPRISNLFLKKISEFYVGNKVILSTGEEGEVIYLNKFDLNKPLIKVKDKYVDLSTTVEIIIKEVL